MRNNTITLFLCLFPVFMLSAGPVSITGQSNVVEITPDNSTGLAAVYVLESTYGATMAYDAASAASAVQWQRFSNLGGAYAEDVTPVRNGARLSVPCQAGDMGYIITENGRQTCYWVVDYSRHELELRALTYDSAESDCSRAVLRLDGNAAEIPYYTINGRHMVLSRELTLDYITLEFDQETFIYRQVPGSETLASAGQIIAVPAALCTTSYTLGGDRFLRSWNRQQSVVSPTMSATAVDASTRATQTPHDADNEQGSDSDGSLGGSAPCNIVFEAAVTDAAVFTEWQISRDADFATVDNSFNELSLDYTFTDQGTTYVRFTANNADGTCPCEGETYQIFIGESKLDIPNAFSPGTSPGVNDLWKVSYKSLVSYKCHIFNSWGKQLFSSTDPSEGWDGMAGGKVVPAGVYYYVIEALGADGIKYKKAGDINVIDYGITPGTSSSGQE